MSGEVDARPVRRSRRWWWLLLATLLDAAAFAAAWYYFFRSSVFEREYWLGVAGAMGAILICGPGLRSTPDGSLADWVRMTLLVLGTLVLAALLLPWTIAELTNRG